MVKSWGEDKNYLWNPAIYGWARSHFDQLVKILILFCHSEDFDIGLFVFVYYSDYLTAVYVFLFCHPEDSVLCVSAPEVLATTPYGHTADWWSLGILMYVILAGRVSHACEGGEFLIVCLLFLMYINTRLYSLASCTSVLFVFLWTIMFLEIMTVKLLWYRWYSFGINFCGFCWRPLRTNYLSPQTKNNFYSLWMKPNLWNYIKSTLKNDTMKTYLQESE